MRLLLQRVSRASVTVGGEVVGEIARGGILVLAGFGPEDGEELASSPVWNRMIEKVVGLRIFPDNAGKLNLGLEEAGGGLLVVSQFTLYADCRKGRRPSFDKAAAPETAEKLYAELLRGFEARLPGRVAGGLFGAEMDVELVNAGPVTIMLDSTDFA